MCSVVMFGISLFLATLALALECDQEGQKAVTIVNKAGKVIEICVNEAAIGHIGGPSDVVIRAECPCWSGVALSEFTQCAAAACQDPGVPWTPDWCTQSNLDSGTRLNIGYGPDILSFYALIDQYSLTPYCTIVPPPPPPPPPPKIQYYQTCLGACSSTIGGPGGVFISADQLQACRAILMSSELWSLCGEPPTVVESFESSEKVAICHKGKTIYADEGAVKAHLGHGDYMGYCR